MTGEQNASNQAKPSDGNLLPNSPPVTIERLTPPSGLNAKMPPVTSAGVDLAKLVLIVLGSTVLILMIYLFWADYVTNSSIGKSYSDLLARTATANAISNPAALDDWETALHSALTDGSVDASPEKQKAERQALDELGRYSLISEKQDKILESCVDLAKSSTTRADTIGDCLDILVLLKKVQSSASSNVALAADVAKEMSAQMQANHAFWIQMAQLLLLNLLLPLLTGLFGYIFGTSQQASSTT